jgi:MerR family transcriptional regulator, light-induced transcriptional regulator
MAATQYSMKIVSRRTGLTPHVIRVWEKRYGAVLPSRTQTNRRLYDDAEIERLKLLGLATKAGHTIKNVVRLTTDELKTLLDRDEPRGTSESAGERPEQSAGAGPRSDFLIKSLVAIKSFDAAGLEQTFNQASVELGRSTLLQQLLAPLLEEIGCCWRRGQLRPFHEHLATTVIRTFLGNFSRGYASSENAPGIVVTTPTGQLHEMGALLAGAAAADYGWRVSYLGPSLASEEIAGAATLSGAQVVALSIVYPENDRALEAELRQLRALLPPEIALITGGRALDAYSSVLTEINAVQLHNLAELGTALDTVIRKQR